jgi:hypothetical protein
MFFNAFGCIYNILHCIGSILQFNSMHLSYVSMYFNVFESILVNLNIFECISNVFIVHFMV